MRAIVGHSEEIDTVEACEELVRQCAGQLGSEKPRAGLLFASVEYDHAAILAHLARRWPGLALVGATTDGEVSSRAGYTADSALLVLLAGDDFEAEVGLGLELAADPARAVAQATSVLRGRKPAVCLTTFAPSSNSAHVVELLQQTLGPGCPILGGLSGDHRSYGRMSEFCGAQHVRDSLPVLFLFGELSVSWGVSSGWFPIGDYRRVTRSDGHIVHAIDDKPALEIFRHYWGDFSSDSMGEYPLAVYPLGKDQPHSLRAALACDKETGAIRFAGDVPQGSLVRLTEVLPDGVLSGTTASMEDALSAYEGHEPRLALMFSCAARKWVLGPKAEHELELVSRALAAHAQTLIDVAGFYCFGEIAPIDHGRGNALRNGFHNETCVTVLIGK